MNYNLSDMEIRELIDMKATKLYHRGIVLNELPVNSTQFPDTLSDIQELILDIERLRESSKEFKSKGEQLRELEKNALK